MDPLPDRRRAALTEYLRYSGIGITMALSIGGFTALGYWADQKLLWKVPVCTLIGVALGLTGAFVHLFRSTRQR